MIHDNIIKSYCVNFEAKTLTINTIYKVVKAMELTDIIFTGYLVHEFNNAMSGSVIFDIIECPLDLFLQRECELLRKNKNYGWPIIYETESDLASFFQINGYNAYEIFSTLGLSGFVLAKHMDIVVR